MVQRYAVFEQSDLMRSWHGRRARISAQPDRIRQTSAGTIDQCTTLPVHTLPISAKALNIERVQATRARPVRRDAVMDGDGARLAR